MNNSERLLQTEIAMRIRTQKRIITYSYGKNKCGVFVERLTRIINWQFC